MGFRYSQDADAADQAQMMAPSLQFQQDRQVGLQVSLEPTEINRILAMRDAAAAA